ncbi:hypothetical protein J4407_01335 [Candidatus Pacearchaeota archaeon]|nr:hypothetical protein [Candidatus Pacearchaeota archaeon]
METKIIHLENKVPERLEKALVKAADEFGWEARIEEKSKRGYRNGFVRETEDYSHTMIHLNGRFLPALKITFNKNNPREFHILKGFPTGFALARNVQRYVETVSSYL